VVACNDRGRSRAAYIALEAIFLASPLLSH